MKQFKVCFVSQHFKDPTALLRTLIKMTPKKSGRWESMEAVTDPFAADYVVCMDGPLPLDAHPIPRDRVVCFAQHPKGVRSYHAMTNVPGAIAVFPNDTCLNPGEWWISHDYDALMAMTPPKKSKDVISITTYQEDSIDRPTYGQRIRFLEEYVKKSDNIDIFGRQDSKFMSNPVINKFYRGVAGIPASTMDVSVGDHFVGKDIEVDYRYALDFDVGVMFTGRPVHNYLSERFYDSMLLWTMPIYFGGDNVHEFVPKDSFAYVRIDGPLEGVTKEAERAVNIVNSTFRESHIKDIAAARHILLNELQTWPFIYNKLRSL